MLSTNSRKLTPSGICWSIIISLCFLKEVNALLSKHPIIESDIYELFGSELCIPGYLMVAPPSVPVPVGLDQAQIQHHQITSTDVKTEEVNSLEQSMAKEKTPMCLVNELARHNKIEHQYRLTDEEGPAHKKSFAVTLRLGTEEYTANGPSIKKAQHSAAFVALQHTNYDHPQPKNLKPHNRSGKGNITPTVELNSLAMKRGEPTIYTTIEIPPTQTYAQHHNYNHYHRGLYTQAYNEPFGGYHYNSNYRGKQHFRGNPRNSKYGGQNTGSGNAASNKGFKVKVKVGEMEFIGEGGTSQAARHDAASKALAVLRSLPVTPVSSASPSPHQETGESGIETDSTAELKSPISLVHEMALKRNQQVSFDVVTEKGPPHMRTFLTRCSVGDLQVTAEGNGKKISKKRAAEKMLEELRKLPPVSTAATVSSSSRVKRKGGQVKKKPRNLIKETKATSQEKIGVQESKQDAKRRQDNGDSSEDMNPISRLIQIQQAKKEKEPEYIVKEERGGPRRREFFIQVTIGDVSYVGSGPNKKIAKRNAAEGLLQVLGYSSSTINRDGMPISSSATQDQSQSQSHGAPPGGPKGRQIVPGLLLMRDNKTPSSATTNTHSGISLKTTAAAAKEYLSSQAEAAKENEVPVIRPTEQLDYLAREINFKVQYTDFTKGSQNEFLSLVSLSTDPPQVCHGSGPNSDISKDQAALNALRSLVEMGLDTVISNNKKSDLLPSTNVTSNATSLNATATTQEMYLGLGNSIPKGDSFLNGK